MASSRARTWLAILAGCLIGGAAALSASRHPKHETAPIETAPAPTAAPEPEPPAASAPTDAAVQPPAFETHYAPPLPAGAKALKTAALHCAWGRIEACLQTAAGYRSGQGVDADEGEAKLYEHRAREISVELCEEGNAEACYALAYMYEHGVAFEPRPEKVPDLLARVRLLCRIKATTICRRVAPQPDGG